jgi:hypothetical protein
MTMHADYDTEADAIEIIVRKVDRHDGSDEVDDYFCQVSVCNGEAVNVSLMAPAEHLHLLKVVAERYDLDHEELLATAQAALAAPDHLVEVSIGKSLVA